MKRVLGLAVLLLGVSLFALEPVILNDCSNATAWTSVKSLKVAPAEGPNGEKALLFSNLPDGNATCKVSFSNRAKDSWDQYQGLSFYAKGDGSDCWSPLAISNASLSYVYFVPMKNTEWVKYTVAWRDFIPEGFFNFIGETNGTPPCGINSLRIGSRWTIWFDNARIPSHSLALAKITLEPIVPEATRYQPAPFRKVVEKLRRREKLVIQFQGDSITAGTSLRDMVNERYSIKTQELLRKWLNTDQVFCNNRAVGGARVNDERAWLNRDFSIETPDLVTIWIGYNDRSSAVPQDYYRNAVSDYLDRICAKTQGKSAILLFAPGPGTGPRFTMMDELAQTIRDLARSRGLEYFDIHAEMKAVGKYPLEEKYMADMAHPNADGHEFIAQKLCEFLLDKAGLPHP